MGKRLVRKVVTLIYSDGSTECSTIGLEDGSLEEDEYVITEANWKMNSISFGAKHSIGMELTPSLEVSVIMENSHQFKAKTHARTKGRLDGLANVFKAFNIKPGEVLKCKYESDKNILYMSRVGEQA